MKIAYITLATTNNFLIGAYNLYKSYLKVNSKYPFYCMVLNSVNTSRYPDLPCITVQDINIRGPKREQTHCLNKLNIFSLNQFDFMCWLDADCLFINNLDNLITCAVGQMIAKNINFCGLMVSDLREERLHVSGGYFITQPNYPAYIKSIQMCPTSYFDETILTKLYADNIITLSEEINTVMYNINNFIFHWDNHADKKYWKTQIGAYLYNLFKQRPIKILPLIKELQDLQSQQIKLTKRHIELEQKMENKNNG